MKPGKALLLMLAAPLLCGYTLTIAWNTVPAVAGYRIYYGGQSRHYTTTNDTGQASRATVSNLTGGETYFFAVTAYDSGGVESDYSEEISYRVRPPAPSITLGNVLVESPVVFWASTNHVDWHKAGTGSAWAVFPATNAAEFYRVQFWPTTISPAP